MKNEIKLKWSKKEEDWEVNYPEGGKNLGTSLFHMIRKFEFFMSYDFEGQRTNFKSLRSFIEENGFDPNSFTITIKKK